jgi:two-component system phosphate regulon sensor histidine kinase PhoR
MTHELKTPIATIRLASEAINNPGVIRDPEKVLHYTRIINDENTRMNDHVENILQMAQFDRKDFIRELKETDMHEVIRESIEKMQLQVAQKGGKIIFEPNAQLHSMPADRRYIAIVLSNLIDNAIKYNTSSPVIKITTVNTGNDLTISVSDNGIGMTTEQCRKVFEKFYRVTTGNLHAVKGFGLGLSYAKAIVLAHGGTISVTSEPGAGSRFDLHFRLTPYN